jgi:hypothetical protein
MGSPTKYPGSQFTSTTAASSFLTYARYLVNEPTASFWNDIEMLQWLNEGILDIVTRTWCLGQTEAVTLANDTLEYTLSNDYITIVTMHISVTATGATKALLKGHPAMVGHVIDPSEIVYWYEWDGKVGLYPTMSDVSGRTCSCYQVATPSVLTLTDNSPLPAWFDDSLTNFIVAKALFKDNEIGTAQSAMAAYEKVVEKYSQDLLNKPVDLINTLKEK